MFTSTGALGNKTLRHIRGPAATALAALSLLVGAGLVANAAGQTPRWHVVQGSDGTLYLLSDTGRYTLQVDPIADEDLAALPDAGPIGPFVGAPPEAVSPEGSPPSDTSGEQSLVPPPDSSPVPLPDSSPLAPPVPEIARPGPAEAPPSSTSGEAPPSSTSPEVGPPPAAVEAPVSNTSSAAPAAVPGVPPSAPLAPVSPSGPGLGQSARPRSGGPPPNNSLPAPPPQSIGAATPTAPTPTATPAAAAGVEAPVLISGSGSQTTRTFTLRGGTYNGLWSATTPTSSPDTFAAILRPADPGNLHTQVIGTALVPGSRSISGQAQLTNLPAGTYSVEIVGGTNWTLTISVQSGPGVGRP